MLDLNFAKAEMRSTSSNQSPIISAVDARFAFTEPMSTTLECIKVTLLIQRQNLPDKNAHLIDTGFGWCSLFHLQSH